VKSDSDGYAYSKGNPAYSADQRMGAYGAITLSFKVDYAINDKATVDFKIDKYQQKSGYRLGGKGSPYLDPFNALFLQVGYSTKF
jgi:Protein of unknown function (DUF3570)